MPIRRRGTLLQVAALHTDNVAVAKFLVGYGVPPNATNDDSDSALERVLNFCAKPPRTKGAQQVSPGQASVTSAALG